MTSLLRVTLRLLLLLSVLSVFGFVYHPMFILRTALGPLVLIIVALSLFNTFSKDFKGESSIYDLLPKFLFSMPRGSLILQALFHSIGEILYRVMHFYDYWIKTSTKIIYSLPFRGEWVAVNGGSTPKTSHSWGILNQRYALDFIALEDLLETVSEEKEHERAKTSELGPSDFVTYGKRILAPADGLVVLTQNGIPDSQKIGRLDQKTPDFRGNFVVIRHSHIEYSFLLHLIPNSLVVSPGDYVTRGQYLGRCGNSGHSTQPHLHFHVQNTPVFHWGQGLAVEFDAPVYFLRQDQDIEPSPVPQMRTNSQ